MPSIIYAFQTSAARDSVFTNYEPFIYLGNCTVQLKIGEIRLDWSLSHFF